MEGVALAQIDLHQKWQSTLSCGNKDAPLELSAILFVFDTEYFVSIIIVWYQE